MRVLIATDAWHPQVNGVVRTLTSLAEAAKGVGVSIEFLNHEGFATVPLPTYANLRLAIPSFGEIARRIEASNPDAIHIATEGTIGFAARAYCRRRGRPFTTSYTTRFPEYIAARAPIPDSLSYWVLRGFHAAATVTMVSTPSLMTQLSERGFQNLRMWTRGVDTDLFAPHRMISLDLPRPIFLTAGRVAIEKNVEAFLSLDLPGSKVVIGEGPQEADLRRRFPDVTFLGLRKGAELAGLMAAADVFVFPSRTDTFGVVQLEALACGVPVAAYPVMGPRDVVGGSVVGVLDEDLRIACLGALKLSREACRDFAIGRSWAASARQFITHVSRVAVHQPHGIPATTPAPVCMWPQTSTIKICQRRRRTVAVAIEIERNAVERAYDRWAPVYDLVFGPVFERGRRASLQAAERIGGRILEVGVGTGISLPDYSRRNRIVGVDISEAMLQRARERVTEIGLSHVEALEVMDAERLNFLDDSFDVVVAQYVVTAVPNPEAALDEFARVLKPGGEIILLSRVGAETGPRKAVEHFIAPAARKLGWRTEFPWERYTNWVTRSERVYLIERRPMPPLGHFSLIRFGKHPAGAIEAQARLAAAV